MKHRIRVAALVLDAEQRILLVRETDYLTGLEFWVPPGGGLEPQDSSVIECLHRELLEETGVSAITIGRLVYLREFSEASREVHHIELFFEVLDFRGTINPPPASAADSESGLSRHARWFQKPELDNLRVYPQELKREFWQDCVTGIGHTKYLGVQFEESD